MGGAAPPWALGACARPGRAHWLVPAVLGSLPQHSLLCPGWHVASPGGVLLHRLFSSSGKIQSCWIKLPSRSSNPSVTSHENMSILNKVTLCQPRGCVGENTGERDVGERAEQPESLAGCLSSRTLWPPPFQSCGPGTSPKRPWRRQSLTCHPAPWAPGSWWGGLPCQPALPPSWGDPKGTGLVGNH